MEVHRPAHAAEFSPNGALFRSEGEARSDTSPQTWQLKIVRRIQDSTNNGGVYTDPQSFVTDWRYCTQTYRHYEAMLEYTGSYTGSLQRNE
ncbi:hypothetical protein JX265_009259 [Neoarthrinium moseri]|uniref:Uncharacterized protein n=1 Tax=Neoarthrinium moseri TaxID=1658444 RepID=A0A9Q0AMZ5_9PEZI|nr:hypothetical protein JX265_009259 [Neoarthrinium moseri]